MSVVNVRRGQKFKKGASVIVTIDGNEISGTIQCSHKERHGGNNHSTYHIKLSNGNDVKWIREELIRVR